MNQFGSIQVREGDLLAGKYRVERVIGVGGMGIVVAARHEQLDQLVAIKFVRDDALDNDEAVERFLREARSAARLRSEHVARVLDVGRLETGAPYMVMEFLDGNDLGKALARDGPMAVDLAAALMLQACEAVAEAHAAGIVHRDLKPENLFLTRTVGGSPKLKVLDFGVSKALRLDDPQGKLTKTRTMLGSPLYMAPEQMRSGRDIDQRIDVWALGVVLFELLTGRSPFEAETMPELCLKVVSEPPLSLAVLRPVLPPGIVAVVEKCLEKDRDKRSADAAELARALEPFAPSRANLFSARGSFDSLRGAIVSHAPPGVTSTPASGLLGPPASPTSLPKTSSIPAWGAERGPDPRPPPPKRVGLAIGIVTGLVVLGAVAVALALRHGPAPAPAAEGAPSGPPAALSDLPPAPPVVLSELPPAPAPTIETSAGVGGTPPAASPARSVAVPPSVRLAPAPQAKVPGSTAPAPTSTGRKDDEDIPAFR
jgi:serine/threonine-protein kinase